MALKITITDAGRAEIVNAQNTGTAPVKITHVALEAAGYTPDPGQTALQNEIKRVSSIAGEVVADDTISVTAKDEGSDAYTVRGFGLITEHGTLFAVYSQADPIIEKASPSTLLLTIDVVFADIDATSLTFGDVTFSNPPASTTVAGVVRLSSAVNSTAQNLAATPNAVKQANDNANSRLAKSANLSDLGNAGTARNNLGLGTAAQQDDARYAHRSNNLADLTAPAIARSNLGLGTAATANTGTGSSNVPTTSQADGRYAQRGQNLADIGNVSIARSNLGLGSAATQPDTRYTHRANNLSDLGSAATARSNLGLGSAATQPDTRYTHRANNLSDLGSAANARSNLGLGTAATMGTTASRTSNSTTTLLQAAGMNNHRTSGDHDGRYVQRGNNLSDLNNAAAARTNLGLGAAATMGTTASRTSGSTSLLLQAAAMNNHIGGGDHNSEYIQLGSTFQVRSALSGAGHGEVGTFAFCRTDPPVNKIPGDTAAGSNLIYTSASGGLSGFNNRPSGTWRCMGRTHDANFETATTLWLRIS
ncbi:tail fiber protein [Billgrantia desiderata]|uniref:tail fiber protein n=1 Tax=Billgrantia desiderata TaxID=52021 RepID=UPI00089F7174|nr:tail fiber protein [Halomonas desiderata]SEG44106.1 Phage tail fibre repeat-containing protein [Halomonas desiderata]